MKFTELPIEKWAGWVIVIGGILLGLQYFLAPLFFATLPFLLAWVMAYFARPLALRLQRYTHLSLGALSVLLVFLFLFLCFGLLFWAGRRAVLELLFLGERLAPDTLDPTALLAAAEAWWSGILTRFPFLAGLGFGQEGEFGAMVTTWLSQLGTRLGEGALSAAAWLAAALPNGMIFLLVTLAAAFYLAKDLGRVHAGIKAYLPPRLAQAMIKFKEGAWQTSLGYLRAYLLLLFMTFFFLLIGFLILRIPYAVLLAALFALLDLLPIIGVGMLLIPWGIFTCVGGNLATGIGLLALYAIIAVTRQLLEPKLIGQQVGLHPLLALLLTYVGLQLFGFVGLMLLPGAAIALRQAFFSGEKKGQQGKDDPAAPV